MVSNTGSSNHQKQFTPTVLLLCSHVAHLKIAICRNVCKIVKQYHDAKRQMIWAINSLNFGDPALPLVIGSSNDLRQETICHKWLGDTEFSFVVFSIMDLRFMKPHDPELSYPSETNVNPSCACTLTPMHQILICHHCDCRWPSTIRCNPGTLSSLSNQCNSFEDRVLVGLMGPPSSNVL